MVAIPVFALVSFNQIPELIGVLRRQPSVWLNETNWNRPFQFDVKWTKDDAHQNLITSSVIFGSLIDLLTSSKGLTSSVEHKNEDIRLALRPPVFNFE